MGFFDSLVNNFRSFGVYPEKKGRILLIGEDSGYFENVKSIKSYTETEIVLSVKSGLIVVSGENLYVKKFCQGDVAICGKIVCIKRQ
jgi:sporulation protein YqfC